MRRWQVVLGALPDGWSSSAHAAELGIAAFNIAWVGSEVDFNEHIRVCSKGLRRPRAHHRQHARRDRLHRQPPADQGLVVQGGRNAGDDQRKRARA